MKPADWWLLIQLCILCLTNIYLGFQLGIGAERKRVEKQRMQKLKDLAEELFLKKPITITIGLFLIVQASYGQNPLLSKPTLLPKLTASDTGSYIGTLLSNFKNPPCDSTKADTFRIAYATINWNALEKGLIVIDQWQRGYIVYSSCIPYRYLDENKQPLANDKVIHYRSPPEDKRGGDWPPVDKKHLFDGIIFP